MKASESLILTLKQGWIAKTSSCKEQIFSWSQSGEWGCKSSETGGVRSPGGHHSKSTSLSWTRSLWSSSSVQSSYPRWSEVSLLVAELRAIGGVIRLSMVELEDEGGEGESAKGKRGTPLRGGSFYHSPFVLCFHFSWLINGESESRVCLFCDLLRVFVSIFVSF